MAWHGTNSTAWRKVSRMVLVRDDYVCQLALPGCEGRATTADHVIPVSLGGSDHPSNLRAACRRCNSRQGGGLGSRRGRLGQGSRRWL